MSGIFLNHFFTLFFEMESLIAPAFSELTDW